MKPAGTPVIATPVTIIFSASSPTISWRAGDDQRGISRQRNACLLGERAQKDEGKSVLFEQGDELMYRVPVAPARAKRQDYFRRRPSLS